MNYIDLAFIIITVVMILIDAGKGFAVSFVGIVRIVVGAPLAFFVSKACYLKIYDNYVKDAVYNGVLNKLSKSNSIDTVINGINEFKNLIPGTFSNSIDTKVNNLLEQISQTITDSVIEPVALVVIRILLFAVIFIAFYLITGIIILITKRVKEGNITPAKKKDFMLGGVFGLIKALVIVVVCALALNYISTLIPSDNSFVKLADDSFALEFVNKCKQIFNK